MNRATTVWPDALRLVQHGYGAFPLVPGEKTPLFAGSFNHATTDPEVIALWADRWPHANIGIATGAGLVVLDVDGPAGDLTLRSRFAPLPPTPTACTPAKGGWHYYFATDYPLGCTSGRLGPKLDTRGHGGYVVAPPSVLPAFGAYAWAPGRAPWECPLAPLPADLLAALHRPAPVAVSASTRPVSDREANRRVARYLATLPPLADGMGRNATAFRLAAFTLHDVGGSTDDARLALDVWNARNLEPLPDDALERAVRNAAKYGGRTRA